MNKYVKFTLIGVIVIVALAAIIDVTNLIFNEESDTEFQRVNAGLYEPINQVDGPIELHLNDNGQAQWSGDITNETTAFTVKLKKGQTVQVVADTMYSWNLVAPEGYDIGCGDDTNYCIATQPDAQAGEEVFVATAPVDGVYDIETTYRVCGLETGCSPINDTITFIVR